ncbi:MAG: tail fiber domain-containing protein [Bacteroidota bacterium]
MKVKVQTLLFTVLSIIMLSFTSTAQTADTSLNSFVIFPFTSSTFDPLGKFTGIGESGGVVGPTANGCDQYGFRAQVTDFEAVNLGLQIIDGVATPTLSFESEAPMLIQQQNAGGSGNGPVTGCGKTLAVYFDDQIIGGAKVIYQVFGSAVATGGNWIPSDLSLKENIQAIPSAMEIVNQLEGVRYNYKTKERPELNLNEGLQYGFIADEVKKVMPEAVQGTYTQEGEIADYDVMNYDMIIPVLTEALKEQQQTIEQLEERLARLEARNGVGSIPRASSKVGLNQNRPNPFNGVTTIDYELPANMNNAQLVIYDMKGSVLEIFDIEAGRGSVEYNAKSLSSGVYFYAIEANGENLARKKMVIK